MDKLIEQERALGYADKELQKWVKEQQVIQREERAVEREHEIAKVKLNTQATEIAEGKDIEIEKIRGRSILSRNKLL